MGTDRWEGILTPSGTGNWSFLIEAWHDRYGTWHHNAEVKVDAGIDVELMLAEGAALLSEAAEDSSRNASDRRTLRMAVFQAGQHVPHRRRSASAAGFGRGCGRRRGPPADP